MAPGAAGDELDEADFAREALFRVSVIAAALGARNKSCIIGCLAAKLWIANKSLESADEGQLARLRKRVPKLLDDLERVIAVCSLSARSPYSFVQ